MPKSHKNRKHARHSATFKSAVKKTEKFTERHIKEGMRECTRRDSTPSPAR
jgi:hypothetical protein